MNPANPANSADPPDPESVFTITKALSVLRAVSHVQCLQSLTEYQVHSRARYLLHIEVDIYSDRK